MAQNQQDFSFSQSTERQHIEKIDVADFNTDNELGKNDRVIVLIKWVNQLYHDENLRSMFSGDWDDVTGISKVNKGRHRNQYYAGKIATFSLETDFLDAERSIAIDDATQPTGVDQSRDGLTAIACGNEIILTTSPLQGASRSVISRNDYARLHSVAFNEAGDALLTASSSLDLLYETDLDGGVRWSMDMWETPYNMNILGQRFYRDATHAPYGSFKNPSNEALKSDPALSNADCVIDDPSSYYNLGLTTNLTPVFPNGAEYGYNDSILVTTFHSGQAWIIDRSTSEIVVAKQGMRNPHGFMKDEFYEDGFIVSDTGKETVSFLSADLGRESELDLSTLGYRKPGLEKVRWLQNTSHLSNGTYCAVMASRQRIVLFNPFERTRRDIAFDPNWGIQLVKPLV